MKKANLLMFLVCIVAFFLGYSWTIVPSINNILLETYKISTLQYSHLIAMTILGAILSSPLIGFFNKKIGMKKGILFGTLCIVLSLLLYASSCFFGNIYRAFLLGQFFLGGGIGSLLTSLNTYVPMLLPSSPARGLTGMYACVNIGSLVCPLSFSGIFSNSSWWQNIFLVSGMEFSIFLLILFFLSDFKKECKSQVFLKKRNGKFYLFFVLIVFYAICEIAFSSWGPLLLHGNKGLSVNTAQLGLFLFWSSFGTGQLFNTWIMKKVSPLTVYKTLPFMLLIGFGGLSLFQGDCLLLFYAIGGFGASSIFSLTIYFSTKMFGGSAEITSGFMVMGYFGGSLIGSMMFGPLLEYFRLSISQLFGALFLVPIFLRVLMSRIFRII